MQNNTINFNKLLYEALNKKENNKTNVCLISNESLTSSHITLECKHSFNYMSILKEIKKQKLHHNNLEVNRLKKNQIKCPYCRNIQNGILPYRDGCNKYDYVNWPEKLAFKPFKCDYIFLSGKKKGEKCLKGCSNKYCLQHKKILDNRNKRKVEKEKKEKEKKEKKDKLKVEQAKAKIKSNITQYLITNADTNTENEIISHITNISSDSYFMKCKQDNNNNNNIFPKLHVTKNYSYFRCQCQHTIIKGGKIKKCKKYMTCSEKLYHGNNKNNSITPKIYKKYLCNTHNYKTVTDKKNNFIVFPDNIFIDIINIPENYLQNTETFNKYLSIYYNKYFHSKVFDYKKFTQFKKTTMLIEDHYVDFKVAMMNL